MRQDGFAGNETDMGSYTSLPDAGMKLRRLRAMGPAELVFRGRQELSKRLERIGVIGNLSSRRGSIRSKLSPEGVLPGTCARAWEDNFNGAGKVLFDRFCTTGADRFFAGVGNERMSTVIAGQARDQAIAAAETVCQKRFDILGYHALFFGDPIDWQLDPISGCRAPFVHWSRIDPLDPSVVGDSKVIWELNRHQWLLALGQAYRFTGDEGYGEIFAAYIGEWMRNNPPGMGINWASSLEVAFRLISWCWALFLFLGSRALSPELFVEMLGWIGAHASHVERHLSYYFSPNTHLTGEALGLFYAGVVFPELRGADRWRTLGTRILVEQMERQVLPDGVYFEQSTQYQHYTVEIYLHFLILAARNGMVIPAAVAERVQQMLDFLLALSRPDGSIPQIGDADGGSLLPLVSRAPDDFRGVFGTAAAFFDRSDYAWAVEGLAPEISWLLGVEGQKVFEALQPAPPATAPSRLFPQGGYVVMRSSWARHAHHLIFDTGPLGCPVSSGHGHADLLGIQCTVFGEPYLIDPGTYCYTANARWRNYFRSTAAHSTVMVDGLSQAIPAGPFAWQERPRARLRRWISTDSFDLADADHDAYRCLPDPVMHRRRVFFSKPRYWVVVDDLDGRAEHRIDLRFQFAQMDVALNPNDWARARTPGGREFLIQAFAAVPLKADLAEGELRSIQGWVSPDYGRREPAPVLTYSTMTRLPLRIVTLLLPVDRLVASPPAVTPFVADGRIGLVFGDARETVCIGEQDIVVDRG
jgi:hypothetical protein